jgi:hypothetical protein
MRDFLDAPSGAGTEFADADLGDLRRTQRLVPLAHVLAQQPGAALPAACGSSAMRKAAYRFLDNDDIAPPDIVQSHMEATDSRRNQVPLVLAVQDTTDADGTHWRATAGLGPLGHTACPGWLVHTTLALTPERLPLGLWAQQVWARAPDTVGKRAQRKQLPIGQKARQKWRQSLEAVCTARDCCPNEWLRLTTVAVDSLEEAIERVPWSSCRWGIAVWARILKSGCRLEARQGATAERLPRGLALDSVRAWRIFYATRLARSVPEVPWSGLWEPDEWQALYGAIHRVPQPPPEPPTLGQAGNWMAQLGGFVGRRRRDRPGAEVSWRGLQHLRDLTTMYRIMRPVPP